MRLLLLFFVMALAWISPAAAKDQSPAEFSKEIRAELRKLHPDWNMQVDPDEPLKLVVKNKGEEEWTIFLYRIYDYCRQVPKPDCALAKDQFVKKSDVRHGKITAKSLRIVVRNSDYAEQIEEFTRKRGKRMGYYRQIGDDLYIFIVSDAPDTIAYVGEENLEEMGLREEDAWDLAIVQTRSITNAPPSPEALERGMQVYEGAEYVGSMIGEPDGWRNLAKEVGPDLFVTVVDDQLVVVGVLPDGPQLDKIAAAAREDCRVSQRCISPHVYRWRKGRWVIAQ